MSLKRLEFLTTNYSRLSTNTVGWNQNGKGTPCACVSSRYASCNFRTTGPGPVPWSPMTRPSIIYTCVWTTKAVQGKGKRAQRYKQGAGYRREFPHGARGEDLVGRVELGQRHAALHRGLPQDRRHEVDQDGPPRDPCPPTCKTRIRPASTERRTGAPGAGAGGARTGKAVIRVRCVHDAVLDHEHVGGVGLGHEALAVQHQGVGGAGEVGLHLATA